MPASDPRPAPEEDDDLTVRGDIETSSVPELLHSLLGSGETGILTFRRDDVTKRLYVREGRVVYAVSTNTEERLGENLMLRGKITARQYLEAGKRVSAGERLGSALVELGALDPDDLLPAVESQVREILMDLLTWTHGDYELVIKDASPDNPVRLNISTENLILEGIRRTRAWSRVLRGIGGDIETVFRPTGNTQVLYKLELTPDEQEVLSRVNGKATVEKVCEVSYLSNFETCRILWALAVLGVVRKAQPGEAAPAEAARAPQEQALDLEEIVERFNQIFNGIYVFLKGRLGDGVDELMETVQQDISRQYGALFEGVELKHYGRADFEQMLANVADLPPEQRKALMISAMNELVFIIQLAVRTRRGAEEEAVVSGIIKEGFRKLGVA